MKNKKYKNGEVCKYAPFTNIWMKKRSKKMHVYGRAFWEK